MKLARLARTLAPLRPVQIYGRALFRLRRPRPDLRPAPPLRALAGWTPAIARAPALTGPAQAVFLNRSGRIDGAAAWNDPAQDKLWLYNLHYFDELAAPADAERTRWQRDLVARWIAENPPGLGNGWEPYPASLRIVNWIKWALAGAPLEAAWLDSLAVQARWLTKRLEWHLLGNHLFANAKALVFAGLFFDGPEAAGWLRRGLDILERELPEQVLSDGGHFELSPMYHAIIFEDLLDLINLAAAAGKGGEAPFARWRETAQRMRVWLAVMTHPDGNIAFFNDSAFGIAPAPTEIHAYAERLALGPAPTTEDGLTHLAESGYIRLQRAGVVALLDVAAVGPSYIPGHAHADTLSFELSVRGRRVVVNGGTATYVGAQRARERATAAHSTVEVAGRDSSEVWGSFRVGRRARITALETGQSNGAMTVAATHDGYRFLSGRPVHRRSWRLDEAGLTLSDEVSGEQPAVARFLLAPDLEPRAEGGSVHLAGGMTVESSTPLAIEAASWSPEFGRTLATDTLVAPVGPQPLVTRIAW